MSGTALTIGQFAEFSAAVCKALPRDISPAEALAWASNGEKLERALKSALVAAAQEHLIDLDADPFIPDGWSVPEGCHQKGSQFTWDASKVKLYLSEQQKNGQCIEGTELRKELAGKPVYNATPLHYTLAIAIALLMLGAVVFLSLRSTTLPQTYRNSTYHFSLTLPADYTVTEAPSANPPSRNVPLDTIEFANTRGNVQLTIEPAADNGSTLTLDSILANHPYMADVGAEPLTVAPGVTGFTVPGPQDHAAQMSELWFEHAGLLYHFTAFDPGRHQLPLIARTISLF